MRRRREDLSPSPVTSTPSPVSHSLSPTWWMRHPALLPLVHALLISLLGSIILILDFHRHSEHKQYTFYSKMMLFDSWIKSCPSNVFTKYYCCVFGGSVVYFLVDTMWMILNKPRTSSVMLYGGVLHHLFCVYGLLGPLFNKASDARVVMLCFVLAESSNPIRTAVSIFVVGRQKASISLNLNGRGLLETEIMHESRNLEKYGLIYLTVFIMTRIMCGKILFGYVFFESFRLISTKLTAVAVLVYTGISGVMLCQNVTIAFA